MDNKLYFYYNRKRREQKHNGLSYGALSEKARSLSIKYPKFRIYLKAVQYNNSRSKKPDYIWRDVYLNGYLVKSITQTYNGKKSTLDRYIAPKKH